MSFPLFYEEGILYTITNYKAIFSAFLYLFFDIQNWNFLPAVPCLTGRKWKWIGNCIILGLLIKGYGNFWKRNSDMRFLSRTQEILYFVILCACLKTWILNKIIISEKFNLFQRLNSLKLKCFILWLYSFSFKLPQISEDFLYTIIPFNLWPL